MKLRLCIYFFKTAFRITTYKDDYTVSGDAFVFEKNFTIGTDPASLYILIDYTTYNPFGEGRVYALPPVFSSTAGAVKVNVYRDTNYTGGTKFDAVNPNTLHPKKTSDTTFTYGATGSDKGTTVLNYLIGSSATPLFSGGSSVSGSSFFIRPNTSKTLVEILNESGESITFHYGQVFFEI